jgi:hypothetical protein
MRDNENYIERVASGKNNYYIECLGFARGWILKQRKQWTSEDLIKEYNESNLFKPDEPRVWGAVINTLSREKLILFIKYTKYKNPFGHGKPCAVWKTKYKHLN